jgi:type III restriction enzyme
LFSLPYVLVDNKVAGSYFNAKCLNSKTHSYYKIKTPIGDYNPDFGVVMKRKSLRDACLPDRQGKESEFYFVIETKGTNDINDKKALKESEVYKIKCAIKHFATLGVDVQYKAPVKDYQYFKTNV